jgi:PhnB protein
MPPQEGMPPMPDEMKDLVLHVSLPIMGGFQLMGSDAPEAFTRRKLSAGTNTYINLLPDTRAEADRLFEKLSNGGEVEMEMADMFWGDYFGSLTDKFGIQWMIACKSSAS